MDQPHNISFRNMAHKRLSYYTSCRIGFIIIRPSYIYTNLPHEFHGGIGQLRTSSHQLEIETIDMHVNLWKICQLYHQCVQLEELYVNSVLFFCEIRGRHRHLPLQTSLCSSMQHNGIHRSTLLITTKAYHQSTITTFLHHYLVATYRLRAT